MPPLLSVERLEKSFARGIRRHEVLRDVSFDLASAEALGVWGKRACGKTTLLLLIAGLLKPDDGTVTFDGRDLAKLSDRELALLRRNEIGWAQRQPPHTALSTGETIALTVMHRHRRAAALTLAAEALDRVGAGDCFERRWSELTDSERTLAAIAGAVVRKPRLLVVDDPTYALNVLERERVVQMLRSLSDQEGVAVLVTSPDAESVLRCHRIASLSSGRLLKTQVKLGKVLDLQAHRRAQEA